MAFPIAAGLTLVSGLLQRNASKKAGRDAQRAAEIESAMLLTDAKSQLATGSLKAKEVSRQYDLLSRQLSEGIGSSGFTGESGQTRYMQAQADTLKQDAVLASLYDSVTGAQGLARKAVANKYGAKLEAKAANTRATATLFNTALNVYDRLP